MTLLARLALCCRCPKAGAALQYATKYYYAKDSYPMNVSSEPLRYARRPSRRRARRRRWRCRRRARPRRARLRRWSASRSARCRCASTLVWLEQRRTLESESTHTTCLCPVDHNQSDEAGACGSAVLGAPRRAPPLLTPLVQNAGSHSLIRLWETHAE